MGTMGRMDGQGILTWLAAREPTGDSLGEGNNRHPVVLMQHNSWKEDLAVSLSDRTPL